MSETQQFQGKVALITGAGVGIGRAIALRLAADGATIAILDIQPDLAQGVVREIETAGGKAMAVQADVTHYEQVEKAVAEVVEALGSIDILINNAGVDVMKLFVETDESVWRKIVDVNYIGFLCVSRAVAPYMIERKSGVVVNIGSDAGRIGNAGDAVYCGSKAAVMATSKAFAREWVRYGIRVNCVAPGPIVGTKLLGDFYEGDVGEKIAKAVPMRRLGTPEEVADVVAFFASDASRYLTGQVLAIDGGLTMIG